MAELHRTPCILYGPNGEVISEINPLPVQLEGESKVVIIGEPTVKIAPAEANKEVAVQNKITVGEVEKGSIAITNKIIVGTLEGEPKVRPEGQTAEGIVISAKPISIAGIDETKKIRSLLTSETGVLKVEGIAGATAAIEGKTATGAEPTDKPIDIGIEDIGKKLRRIKGDENGSQYSIPFNPEKLWRASGSETGKTGTQNLAEVANYRYVITQIWASLFVAETLTSLVISSLKITNSGLTLHYPGTTNSLTAGTGIILVNLSANPIYVAEAVNTKLVIEIEAATKVTLAYTLSGYMMKG